MKHVVFRVENEEFAISVEHVLSIEMIPEIRPLPTADVSVKGLANLRGNVITVLDMNSVVHGRVIVSDNDSRMLVVGNTGFLVNAATDIVEIIDEDVEPFDGNEYVSGVWKAGDGRLLLVVDVDKLLSA